MTPFEIRSRNLTRWNRAGLARFRYVDANAVTLLETIRQNLAGEFADWKDIQSELPEDETSFEKSARLSDQYGGPRRDWGWEIARAFARSSHILTEHINAFANEGSLSTATQWEYLRRLVSMLDYYPRPPASAATTIALVATADKAPGTVSAGFQIKHSPEDGGAALIFETLDDIEIDAGLNALRLKGWDYNPTPFDPFATLGKERRWTLPEKSEATAGQPGILFDGSAAVAVRIADIDGFDIAISGGGTKLKTRARSEKPSYKLGDARLLLEPDNVYAPALNGANVVRTGKQAGFASGQIVGWKSNGVTGFGRIEAADRFSIRLTDIRPSGGDVTAKGVAIYAASQITHDQFIAGENEWRFRPLNAGESAPRLTLIGANSDGSLRDNLTIDPSLDPIKAEETDEINYRRLASFSGHDLFYIEEGAEKLLTVSDGPAGADILDLEGGAGEIRAGDHLVAESATGGQFVIEVASIAEREDSFSITLTAAPDKSGAIVRLHGPFITELRPKGHDRNPNTVRLAEFELAIEQRELPPGLIAGKTVIVEPETDVAGAKAFRTTILDVILPQIEEKKRLRQKSGAATHPRLVLAAAAVDMAGYTIGNLIVRANAVDAGHGETKPPKTLGSGDASRTNQSFIFEKTDVSFVADSSLSQGVRASVEVSVGGRRYEEVATLADSEATDPHYTVRKTEEGFLRVTFGDGFNGRRLPSGRNNIAIGWRAGTGASGNNLGAGSLEKPVKPHPLVDAVVQPIPTSGGEEMEGIAEIRTKAPAHLRSLERGVSLADFEHLAKSQPGVWHAKAFLNPAGANKRELVELSIVPADGGPLGELGAIVVEKLAMLSPAGITFKAERFEPIALAVRIGLRVDTDGFDYSQTEEQVRDAVHGALTLQQRPPGKPVFLSEIFQAVEAVEGVINSDASITIAQGDRLLRISRGKGGEIVAAWPTSRQVIYSVAPSAIAILQEVPDE